MTKTHSGKREELIAEALNTPQGKAALAAAMTAPISTSIMYQNVGRKLLMVDEPPCEYPGARDAVSDYMKKWVQK